MTSIRQSDETIRRFLNKHFSNFVDFEMEIRKSTCNPSLECTFRIETSNNPDINTNVLEQTSGKLMLARSTPYVPLSGHVSDIFSREEIAMMFITEIASKEVERRLLKIVKEDIEYDLERCLIKYDIDTILTKDFNMFSDYIEIIVLFRGQETGDLKKMKLHLSKYNMWVDPPYCDKYSRYYRQNLLEGLYSVFPELKKLDES